MASCLVLLLSSLDLRPRPISSVLVSDWNVAKVVIAPWQQRGLGIGSLRCRQVGGAYFFSLHFDIT